MYFQLDISIKMYVDNCCSGAACWKKCFLKQQQASPTGKGFQNILHTITICSERIDTHIDDDEDRNILRNTE